MPDVRLYGSDLTCLGTVTIARHPSEVPVLKMRFAGECSGGGEAPFPGERFFVRNAVDQNRYTDCTDQMVFFLPSDVVAPAAPAEPPAATYGANW